MATPSSVSSNIHPLNLNVQNLADSWKLWIQRFKIYLVANNLENEQEKRKVCLLMHYLGEDIMSIFFSFNVSLETITYKTLVEKFDEYFSPKKNIAVERHNFFKRKQESNETIDKFVTGLKILVCRLNLILFWEIPLKAFSRVICIQITRLSRRNCYSKVTRAYTKLSN